MEHTEIKERELHPISGAVVLGVGLLGLIASTRAIWMWAHQLLIARSAFLIAGVVGWVVFPVLMAGLKIVKPNEARVLTLFGKYHGTIKKAGFFFVNPFSTSFSPTYDAARAVTAQRASEHEKQGKQTMGIRLSKNISLKTQTLNNDLQKVNDVLGNPIIIGAIVIWRVANPTRAVFGVENYVEYLSIQADSTVRNTASLYPYDVFEEEADEDGVREKTLRGSSIEIAESMRDELQKRVAEAGLVIEEVRVTHLAYAEEIAAAMLQRQQAAAVIAARQKIVDGAVGMVKMAIDKLGEEEVVVLDEERKAAMVSNLLVVLCGNKDAQPVLNSGSIY